MLTDYLPPRLRHATGFNLIERDLLAEVHAQDRAGACREDAEALATALCGIKPHHIEAAIVRLRKMALIEVVLDANDQRCLRLTALGLTYWESDDDPGGERSRETSTPNQTHAKPTATLKTDEAGYEGATVGEAEQDALRGVALLDEADNWGLHGCRGGKAAPPTPAGQYLGTPAPAPIPPSLRASKPALEVQREALTPHGPMLEPEVQPRRPGSECATPDKMRAGLRERSDPSLVPPVSEACPPEGGVREAHVQAPCIETECAAPEKFTREEWVATISERFTPPAKLPPPALQGGNGTALGLQVVAELQGGYVLPDDLFRALPAEVVLATHRGEPCIPMKENKKPHVRWKEFQERTPTPREFRRWLLCFGDDIAGWARVTGRVSNLVVFDDDTLEWFDKWGVTPHVRTRRGGHWLLQYPGWKVATVNSKTSPRHGAIYPNLDIRADGGYSIICGFGGNYTWLREPTPDPLDLLPHHARRFFGLYAPRKPFTPREATGSGGLFDDPPPDRTIARALEKSRSIGRNNAGFWLALRLRDTGHTEADALRFGHAYVYRVGRPDQPYTWSEWEATVRSAYSRAPRR